MLSKISEHANCWAVVFDVAEKEARNEIIEALFTRNMSAVRSATPYFSFYVLSALAKTGRHRESLEYIRKHWRNMLDWGATTWWETWEPKASL
ncbi:MAG: alpha-L-rhamnosidase, partial [Bacteroidota bacterium]